MSLLIAWRSASGYTHIYSYWSNQEFLIWRSFQLALEAMYKLLYPSPEVLHAQVWQKGQFSATDAIVDGILQTKPFTSWTSPLVPLSRKLIYACYIFLVSLDWFPSSCIYVNADVFFIILQFIIGQFYYYEHKTGTNVGKFFTVCIKSSGNVIE